MGRGVPFWPLLLCAATAYTVRAHGTGFVQDSHWHWPLQDQHGRTLAEGNEGTDAPPFVAWLSGELGALVDSVAACFSAETAGNTSSVGKLGNNCASGTAPTAACLQCLYGSAGTPTSLAAVIADALVKDTPALSDVCARQPKPRIVLPFFTRGTAWWTSVLRSLFSGRTPALSQLDVQLWLGPVPTGPNDTYTVCGELGSSSNSVATANNVQFVKGLGGTAVKFVGGLQEVASLPLVGAYPLTNPSDFWENKELGRTDKQTGTPIGLFYPRAHMLVAYRADWFDELGVSPPTTWDEMIQLAHALSALPGWHSTLYNPAASAASNEQGPGLDITWPGHDVSSWPAQGSAPIDAESLIEGPTLTNQALAKRWPLCLDLAPNCKGADILAAIAATMLQANGTSQNPYLDPVTLIPYTSGIGSAAWAAALRVHRDLALLASPAAPGLQGVAFSSCAAFSRAFALGACAMTIDWEGALPFLYAYPGLVESEGLGRPQDVRGNVGWAALPGSSSVVDGITGRLTPCTPSLCPQSRRERVHMYTRTDSTLGVNASTTSSDNIKVDVPAYGSLNSSSLQIAGVLNRSEVQRINRAPFSAQAFTVYAQSCGDSTLTSDEIGALRTSLDSGISRLFDVRQVLSTALQSAYANAKAAGYFSSPYFSSTAVPGPAGTGTNTTAGLINSSLLRLRMRKLQQASGSALETGPAASASDQPPPAPATSPPFDAEVDTPPALPSMEPYLETWAAALLKGPNASVHPDDGRRLLSASWRARFQYTNQVPQMVLPTEVGPYVRMAYEEGLGYWYADPGATTSSTLQRLTTRINSLVAVSPGSVRVVLYAATGYTPSTDGGSQSPGGSHGSKGSDVNLAAAVATPLVVATVLIVLAVAAMLYARRTHNRTLLGAVRPPKGAPGTTIVLTDIQDSTHIWEALPAHVVDAAVVLHHATIRHLVAIHSGYESTTEGDSFVLAFHKASDAALFATDLQRELLLVEWPQQLLEYQGCSPVYVASVASLAPERVVRTFSKPRATNTQLMITPQMEEELFGRAGGRDSGAGTSSHEAWELYRHVSGRPASDRVSLPLVLPRPRGSSHGGQVPLPPRLSQGGGQQDKQGQGSWLQQVVDTASGRIRAGISSPPGPLSSGDTGTPVDILASAPAVPPAGTLPTQSSVPRRPPSRAGSLAQVHIVMDGEPLASSVPLSALLNDWQDGNGASGGAASFKSRGQQLASGSSRTSNGLQAGGPLSPRSPRGAARQRNAPRAQPSLSQLVPNAVPEDMVVTDPQAVPGTGSGPVSGAFGSCAPLPDSSALGDRILSPTANDVQATAFDAAWFDPPSNRARTVGEQLGVLAPLLHSSRLPSMGRTFDPASGQLSPVNGGSDASYNFLANDNTPKGDKVVIFRGLRVRVGCASVAQGLGVEVSLNTAAGRMRYGGPCVAVAKAVQDAAQGGMVLVSASTFAQLAAEVLSPTILVMHMGEHVLASLPTTPQAIYQLIPQSMLQRTPHLGPIRSECVMSLGCLQAPCDEAAICFMHVVGVASLEATDHVLAQKALALYHTTAQARLLDAGGYLLEAADGLVLTAFTRPGRAIRWALDTVTACLAAEWPEELLAHEVGEVVALTMASSSITYGHHAGSDHEPMATHTASYRSHVSQSVSLSGVGNDGPATPTTPGVRTHVTDISSGARHDSIDGAAAGIARARDSITAGRRLQRLQAPGLQQLLFRGLRLKCGIDFGPVRVDVVAATGRIGMRGRVMNRASRVAGVAKSGQVVTTLHAWDEASADLTDPDLLMREDADQDGEDREVVGTTLGAHRLKGLAEELELILCCYPRAINKTNSFMPFTFVTAGAGGSMSGQAG